MALMKIVKYGDPVLLKQGKKVEVFDDTLKTLAADMVETMISAPGIGLAAPQVGKSLQLCIVDLSVGEDPEQLNILVNPEIIEYEGIQREEEGCLSFPSVFVFVERPEKVKVRYQDLEGTVREIEGEGLLARALCHEIDHLNGEVFINKLGPVKKKMTLKQITKMKKEGQWD